MNKILSALAAIGLIGSASAAPFPGDLSQWYLVAHAGTIFAGDSELASTYSYGTFDSNPTAATPDFYRSFSGQVTASTDILFITGNGTQWAVANYMSIRAAMSAQTSGDPLDIFTGLNITFKDVGTNGVDIGPQAGAVLFRGSAEDPWVSLGSHWSGFLNHQIFWGESGYPSGEHAYLTANNGGMNVYVGRLDVAAVPEPSQVAASLLMIGGIAGFVIAKRRKKSSEALAP
ncbi:MAG: PEP-CTERM sorting domain-containing protein [Verrucomicrobiota bacterium]